MSKVLHDLLVFFFHYKGKKDHIIMPKVDFDFGQVHIVWWMSYSQAWEQINAMVWISIQILAAIWRSHHKVVI